MKTNFRQRNNAPYRKRLIVIVLVLAVGGLAVSFLRRPIAIVAGPVWQGRAAVAGGFQDLVAYFKSKSDLESENAALRQQVASYDSLVLSCRAVVSSREALTEAFGRTASSSGIAVGVLVHPPETVYDMLTVDAGSAEGVHIGDHARLPEGGLIGSVTAIFDHVAKITLYSSSAEETTAVLERNSVPVTLIGRGGGSFEVDLPREVAVEVGDKIISPELGGDLVGVVRDVSSVPTDSFKHILVEGVVNVYSVRYLLIKP